MDRQWLIQRNQQMAQAFHSPPVRHQLRRELLRFVARLPYTPQRSARPRLLFIRPDHIGDLLLATPAIRAVKQARPQLEIHVLAGAWAAPILSTYAEIDQVLTIDFPGFNRQQAKTSTLAPYQSLVRVSRQLRAIGYSAAVVLRPDHWWGAMLAAVAGIPRRIGYALPDVAPFLTDSIPFQAAHAVRQNLRLVDYWTGQVADSAALYSYTPDVADTDTLRAILQANGLDHTSAPIAIHPGAGTWVKQWDESRWAQVADVLYEQTRAPILFTGAGAEAALIERIRAQAQHKHYSLAGLLSLGQLAALYQQARLVLGADSGPLHIAAAVSAPTVALFGPADPLEFAPWGDRQRHIVLHSAIACRPCRVLDWGADDPAYHPCVREIGLADVLAAARRLLNPA